MKKKIRIYRQHAMETCGIACPLMLPEKWEKGRFRLRDPIPGRKPLHLTAETPGEYMDTSVGKICIIVGEPNDSNTL